MLILPKRPVFFGASWQTNANISVPKTATKIAFNVLNFDVHFGSAWSDGTGGFVVPSAIKFVRVNFQARFTPGSSSGSTITVSIRQNGTPITYQRMVYGASSNLGVVESTGVLEVLEGDTIDSTMIDEVSGGAAVLNNSENSFTIQMEG